MGNSNIHPVDDRLVQRHERESKQGHLGGVFWLTGLSGSGKSTIAEAVERRLFPTHSVRVLDGDNVRSGLNSGLTFSLEDRKENIRRVAEVAKLFIDTGYVILCSFVSPTKEMRAFAKAIIGEKDFYEVHISASLETCENRDVKGLYAKARSGQIRGFTGIDSPYEPPESPDLIIDTASQEINESSQDLIHFILTRTPLD